MMPRACRRRHCQSARLSSSAPSPSRERPFCFALALALTSPTPHYCVVPWIVLPGGVPSPTLGGLNIHPSRPTPASISKCVFCRISNTGPPGCIQNRCTECVIPAYLGEVRVPKVHPSRPTSDAKINRRCCYLQNVRQAPLDASTDRFIETSADHVRSPRENIPLLEGWGDPPSHVFQFGLRVQIYRRPPKRNAGR